MVLVLTLGATINRDGVFRYQTAVIGPISDCFSSSICCKIVYLTVRPKNRGVNV